MIKFILTTAPALTIRPQGESIPIAAGNLSLSQRRRDTISITADDLSIFDFVESKQQLENLSVK